MEFRVLGPVQVVRDGEAVEPGSPKLRALLIDLLIHHGTVVARETLIDDLWSGSPPSTGLGVLQNYVSQLRKSLGPGLLITRGQGYVLDIDPAGLDSARFEVLVGQARVARGAGEPEAAAAALRQAGALWRGPALVDVAGEAFAQPEIARLGELRAVAAELEVEVELDAGRHREVVARVERLLADHPLRERLWALLMTALYRSGRQAEVSPCAEVYDVQWLSSYIASDGTRCVCVYEAPDAEAVRRTYRAAGVAFENVWTASPLHRTPD